MKKNDIEDENLPYTFDYSHWNNLKTGYNQRLNKKQKKFAKMLRKARKMTYTY